MFWLGTYATITGPYRILYAVFALKTSIFLIAAWNNKQLNIQNFAIPITIIPMLSVCKLCTFIPKEIFVEGYNNLSIKVSWVNVWIWILLIQPNTNILCRGKLLKEMKTRMKSDGLNSLKYDVLKREYRPLFAYIFVRIPVEGDIKVRTCNWNRIYLFDILAVPPSSILSLD